MTRYGVIAYNRMIGNQARYAGGHAAAFKFWRENAAGYSAS